MSKLRYLAAKDVGREDLILNLRTDPVAETHPSLTQEWLPDSFGPQCFSRGSGRTVWWHCQNGHYFTKKVSSRTQAIDHKSKFRGCPVCAKRKSQKLKGLAWLFPHLMTEWDYGANGTADFEPPTSLRTVLWKCPREHRFACMIYSRTTENQDCPECDAGERINLMTISENAVAVFDHYSEEYCGPAPQPNLGYRAESLPLGHKVWWKCKLDSQHYFYRSAKQLRETSFRCPQCDRRCPGELSGYPELMAQFHRTLNGRINPLDLTADCASTIWWFCKTHPTLAWQSPVCKRAFRGEGCPNCAKSNVALARPEPEPLEQSHTPATDINERYHKPKGSVSTHEMKNSRHHNSVYFLPTNSYTDQGARPAHGAIGSTTPNSGNFTTITLTNTVGAHNFLANTSSSSAAPTFTSITAGDLPSSVVTGVGADLSPLFSTSISSQNLEFTQSTASNGTLFGNFAGGDEDPIFNDPGSSDQILGVTHDGTGLEYKTLTAGDNITITPDVGTITISATGGGGGGGPLNNFSATAFPGSNDDESEGYEIGSLWFYPGAQYLGICIDNSEFGAQWRTVGANSPLGPDIFNNGVSINLLSTVPDSSNYLSFPPSFGYIAGQRISYNFSDFNYDASSWTYDLVDVYGNLEHFSQDYDTDPPDYDPNFQLLYQKVVTDDLGSGYITEIDSLCFYVSPTLLSYAQLIPTTTGLLLQTSSNPQGITYGPLELASIDPTGATGNQLVAFDGTNFGASFGLNGVTVATDSSITLTADSASLQSLDASGGEIDLTLPTAGDCAGKVFFIANTASSGSNTVEVSLASGDIQVGTGDLSLVNGAVLGVISDGGSNWIVLVSK